MEMLQGRCDDWQPTPAWRQAMSDLESAMESRDVRRVQSALSQGADLEINCERFMVSLQRIGCNCSALTNS